MRTVGRRLAFDYGDVRTGVAVSDSHGILVTPYGALQTQSEDFLATLRNLLDEIDPLYIVVGSPKHLSGEASQKMKVVEEFCRLLESMTQVPIHRVDERLTTVTAASRLRAAGKNAKESKGQIDAVAAATILEQALAAEKSGTL